MTRRRAVAVVFAALVSAQAFISFLGIADTWTRGHNGWGGAAYNLSARNTLRWGTLFPWQYGTRNTPPRPDELYTHHPLALHLHTTASVAVFGDHPWAVRLVPAVHNVLTLLLLLLLVRRFWDDAHAVLAGGLFLLQPINLIYANMPVHSQGFLAWSLAMFYAYLRWQTGHARGWYAVFLVSFALAALWDWPAYELALPISIHAAFAAARRNRETGRRWWRLGADGAAVIGFCAVVLASLAAHVLAVRAVGGHVDELAGAFRARQDVSWEQFRAHLRVTPALMFSVPVLALSGAWVVQWSVRAARGRGRARDLVPVAFAFAGTVHYVVFKVSAVVHSYWGWTLLPFVAIATAAALLATGRWLAAGASRLAGAWVSPRAVRMIAAGTGASVALLMVPLLYRAVDLAPKGRSVGGSLWFVAPERGPVTEVYDSGRPELDFAEKVNAWTTRATGVVIDPAFERFRPEPRFATMLDRTIRWSDRLVDPGLQLDGVSDGWVFIGVRDAVDVDRLLALAARHPLRVYSRYFMLDFRRAGRDVKAWRVEERPGTIAWWYFVSPFERPLEAVPDQQTESVLRHRVESVKAP